MSEGRASADSWVRPAGDRVASEAAFALFSGLWALHVIFHYTSYASYFVSLPGFLAFASSVYLLLDPRSPMRLALSGYFYALAWFAHLGSTPNHETLGSFVALAFISALVYERLTEGRGFSPGRALERAAPVIRSILIGMYFWATFHKLNHDFLFAERATCGNEFYRSFLDRFPFMPAASGTMNLVLAWATVGVEAVIGILLLVPRTRKWGIAIGWGFHLMLTLSPKSGFYNFTSLLFPLFLLFAPASMPSRLGEVWRESRLRSAALRVMAAERWRAAPKLLGWSVVLIIPIYLATRDQLGGLGGGAFFDFFSERRVWWRDQAFGVWMLWSLPLSYFVWRAVQRTRGDRPEPLGRIGAVPKPLWVITALFLLWGSTPYLGLKTENSFAMFSNLRTETAPNHYLVPEALKIFDFQQDTVQVLKVVGRTAQGKRVNNKFPGGKRGYEVPYEGLRGWLRRHMRYGSQFESITYRRNGQRVTERFEDGGEVFRQGFWAHKFLLFRRYRPEGPMTCEH